MDKVAYCWPGELAIYPKEQLDEVTFRGAREGGKLLDAVDLGVQIATKAEDGDGVIHSSGDLERTGIPVADASRALFQCR